MMTADLQYEINGFQYRTWDDVEDDNIKTFHYCYRRRPEDGQLIEIRMPGEFYNHSPYSLITPDEFRGFLATLEVFIQSK